MPEETTSVVLERTYPVPPDVVWAAWTDPVQLAQWFFPGDKASVKVHRFDARVGGGYRIEFPGEAAAHIAIGSFRVVDHPRRLAFSWNWEGAPAMPHSFVTVEMRPVPNGTHLVLRHEGLPTSQAAPHKEGWNGILDRGVRILATGRT